MGLRVYHKKRDFARTPEPKGRKAPRQGWRYVIQKHDATRLHYDFRLELDGVLKSWAIPRGPSLDPAQKRLAVEVEDHPLEYGKFEGMIPEGGYGAGPVLLWDRGRWRPQEDAHEGYRRGRLKFVLEGEKLSGGWTLVRMMGPRSENGKNWLLIKERDEEARKGKAAEIVARRPESVTTGRAIEEIGANVHRKKTAKTAKSRSTRTRRANRERRAKPAEEEPAPRARTRHFDLSSVPGARKGALPSRWQPELATLVTVVPAGDEWLHEIKFDGYRVLARVDEGRARLFTRSGQDWTDRFPKVAEAAARLPARRLLLDGEVVVLGPDGVSSFQGLQNAIKHPAAGNLVYYVFDLLHQDAWGLAGAPLEHRKRALASLLGKRASGAVRYSDHVIGKGEAFYGQACKRGLEGIVSKRRASLARSGRGNDWLKIKCSSRQEFVIGGFTDPQRSRVGFGALLLGVQEDGRGLRYAGRVGTGFDHEVLRDLRKRLEAMQTREPPFFNPPRARDTHWVKPRLVAEVTFAEWTSDGLLRHPSFMGLREDKPAKEIVRERARGKGGRDAAVVAGVAISHPDKILYPERELTKLDVARYLESVAERMVPEIAGRPLMLLRCPEGRDKPCFFQKHPHGTLHESLEKVSVREKKGRDFYVVVRDATGLVALLQAGSLEIHVWSARVDRIEEPDRMVFDIDPDPGTPWAEVPRTAVRLREHLAAFDLESFVKTTGGKGLHVVVPLRRGPDWDTVGAFAAAIAERLIREDPEKYTVQIRKLSRKGRIFLDTLRNRRAHTWVAPYSPRAREGATVSCPVGWEEITPRLRNDRFTVETLSKGLPRRDPWKGIGDTRQTITAAMLEKSRR